MVLGRIARLEIDEPFHVIILKYGSLPQLKLYSEIATNDMSRAYHLFVSILGTRPSDIVRTLLREAINGYSPVGLPWMALHASCSRCRTASFPYAITGHPIDFRWLILPICSVCVGFSYACHLAQLNTSEVVEWVGWFRYLQSYAVRYTATLLSNYLRERCFVHR
jgi:hypothetical protein